MDMGVSDGLEEQEMIQNVNYYYHYYYYYYYSRMQIVCCENVFENVILQTVLKRYFRCLPGYFR